MRSLRTSEIARAANIHPNTVRTYEEWGLISVVPREPNGYRRYSELHMDQVKLIRMNLKCTYLGGRILDTAYDVLHLSAQNKILEALEREELLVRLIQNEKDQAECAFQYLEDWVEARAQVDDNLKLSIKEAAKLLDITIDMLYDWERNGLISIPRNEANGYRIYGSDEINRLRVIRMLRKARYSNMAILRVMRHLDSGRREDLKKVIDTPEPDDDIVMQCFSDRWLFTLDMGIESAKQGVKHLKAMLKKYQELK